MDKSDFIDRLKKVRKVNKAKAPGRIKKRYHGLDNEISWRLFQLFPSGWKDADRFRGMTLVITHMTAFILSRINSKVPAEDIVDELYSELKGELEFRVGKKYLKELVSQVTKIKLLNP